MVVCDVTLATVAEQGSSSNIAWTYVDDSSGEVVVPSPRIGKLFDPSGAQRDPADTANTTTVTFIPTTDTNGSVTGAINKHYVTVNFDAGAAVGVWHVETTYTHEGVARTRNVCFIVVSAGASVGGGTQAGTVPVYAIAKDVRNFLILNGQLDQNSTPSDEIFDSYITMAEGEFEARTGTAFKPVYIQDEVHDIEALRSRHRDFLDEYWLTVPRPIHLNYRPVVLPFDQNRGHRVEVYEGSDTTASSSDPVPRWSEWLLLTHGRDNDYWIDWQKGHLYIRKTFVFRRAQAVRVSYEYGKAITTTTSAVSTSPSVVNVTSTHGYQTRGIIRIGRTYYHHTGKTATSFTGITYGVYDTQPDNYASGAEVYEVPENIRRMATMRASSLFLQNEVFVSAVGDNAGTAPSFADKIRDWDAQWEKGLSQYQRWSTF